MKLYKHWFAEIAEFEVIYRRKDASQLKRFITSRKNDFRMPYERSVLSYPRRCVLVGTTNETEFLNDPTGSRRFWIIPTNKEIPTEKVSQQRDKIWATAYHLYKDGFQWWLTKEEEVLREDYNKQYEKEDNWTSAIITYVNDKHIVTIPEILLNCVNKHLATQEQKDNNRVAAILRRNGWKQTKRKFSGIQRRVWVRGEWGCVHPRVDS